MESLLGGRERYIAGIVVFGFRFLENDIIGQRGRIVRSGAIVVAIVRMGGPVDGVVGRLGKCFAPGRLGLDHVSVFIEPGIRLERVSGDSRIADGIIECAIDSPALHPGTGCCDKPELPLLGHHFRRWFESSESSSIAM